MKKSLLGLVLAITSLLPVHAQEEARKPLFIKADCDGTISSAVLASLREAVKASTVYLIVPSLNPSGKLGITIGYVKMACKEQKNIAAISSIYGLAKCVSSNQCHASLDGSSLNVVFCEQDAVVECGLQLFKQLEGYLNTAKPILRVD